MSHADLTGEDRALLVRIARENALKTVAAAKEAMLGYANLMEQEAEQRDDYLRALNAYDLLSQAQQYAEETAGGPAWTW
jgi:hypothetical protein